MYATYVTHYRSIVNHRRSIDVEDPSEPWSLLRMFYEARLIEPTSIYSVDIEY